MTNRGRGTGTNIGWNNRGGQTVVRRINLTRLLDGNPNSAKKAIWTDWIFGTPAAVVIVTTIKQLSALGVG